MRVATDFVILRDVEVSGLKKIPVEREPVSLVTLIDEERFNDLGHGLIHNDSIFFEDRGHDWQWQNGMLRYFTRIAERADIILIYEESEAALVDNFCHECGTPTKKGCEHRPAKTGEQA